jgi:hypothetical protein
MVDFRQRMGSDFRPNALPTLNAAKSQMPLLFSERFDTPRVSLNLPGYSAAAALPADWQVWDPGGNGGIAFQDAVEKCAVLGVSSIDGIGSKSVAGILHPWPKMKDQDALLLAGKRLQWRIFARVACWLWNPTGPNSVSPNFGAMVSCDNLLPAGDGAFVLAGNVFNEAGVAQLWQDHATLTSQNTLTTIGARTVVLMLLTYDPAFDVTSVQPLGASDGVGFVAPPANVANPGDFPATVLLKGFPKWVGFAVDIAGTNDPELDSFNMRGDYVHIFGSSEDAANALNPAIAEGAQDFTL